MTSLVSQRGESYAASQTTRVRTNVGARSLSTSRAARPIEIPALPKFVLRQILGLNPFKTSYFSLFRPLKSIRSRIVIFIGTLSAISAGVPLPIIGIIFGELIDGFPPTEAELTTRLTQLLIVAVVYFALTWTWAFSWAAIGEEVSKCLREQIVERALGMELAYFDTEYSDITKLLMTDVQTIQLGTSEKVGLFIQSISYFVAAFTVGFILNARLTGILFAAVIPTIGLIISFGTKSVSHLSRRASSLVDSASLIADGAIQAVTDVQAFGAEDTLTANHRKYLFAAAQWGIKKAFAGALMLGGVFFTAYSANALAFFEGAKMISAGSSEGSAGTVYAVVFLILDASFVIGQFGPFIQTFALAAAAGRNVFQLLDHPESHINVYSSEGQICTRETFNQDIYFHRVNFVYPARPTIRVLDGFSINIKKGQFIGICGVSGSGKSTIASLLLRLYDPNSGQISIGGNDIREFNIASWRSFISVVDQDPILFSGTILSNIMHGLQDYGEPLSVRRERCIQAAKDADAWEFIQRLPDGIDARIGDSGGTQLSGGQKQRLCLARALVGDPALLILDEFTSALDSVSEAAVLGVLSKDSARSGRTIIMIAHRLATIKDADDIIMMAHGNLLEHGTHEELMTRVGGSYRALVNAQQFSHSDEVSPSPEPKASGLAEATIDASTEAPRELPLASAGTVPPSSIESVIRCLQLTRAYWFFTILGLIASIITGGIVIGEAIVFGHLIQVLNSIDPGGSTIEANKYCLVFFILALVALFAYTISGCSFGVVSEHLIRTVRDISLQVVLRQNLEWFSLPGHSSYSLLATINKDSGNLSGLSGVLIGTIFCVLTSLIGGIALGLSIAWKIAVVLLAATPVMVLSGFMRLRMLAKFEERHDTAYNTAAALASEACSEISTVAALGRERGVLEEFRIGVEVPYRDSLRFAALGNIIYAFALSITYFVYALAYWWGSRLVRSGEYSSLQFFIVLPALLFSAQACGQMFSLAPEFSKAMSAARNVFQLHDQKAPLEEVKAWHSDSTIAGDEKFLEADSSPATECRLGPSIEFRSVCFTYSTRPTSPAFENLSFTIRPGEFVALVGRSGAGKSSIISLIERFIDPTSGIVLIDGVDIRDVRLKEHRGRMSLVAQEPSLFAGSIAFNVGLGAKPDHEASQDEIEEVCKLCDIHDFIMSLPEGYQTNCGPNGYQLSGGQRQRLALARSLIRNPDILLLDEATSALDSHADSAIQKALMGTRYPRDATNKGGKAGQDVGSIPRTTILIAHRLASVQHADRILVFEGGRIVEDGMHDELVGRGGLYSELVQAQTLPD